MKSFHYYYYFYYFHDVTTQFCVILQNRCLLYKVVACLLISMDVCHHVPKARFFLWYKGTCFVFGINGRLWKQCGSQQWKKTRKYSKRIKSLEQNYEEVRFVNLSVRGIGIFGNWCDSFTDALNNLNISKSEKISCVQNDSKIICSMYLLHLL